MCGRRPTRASTRNLALRLEYASLDVQVTDSMAVMFGLHEMPWLTYEETLNRYRVLGPFFSERAWTEDSLGLLPGPPTSARASRPPPNARTFMSACTTAKAVAALKSTSTRASMAARPSVRSPKTASSGKVSISGFYQYGWYARDRPRNVAIGDGQPTRARTSRHRAVSAGDGQSVRRRGRAAPRDVVLR